MRSPTLLYESGKRAADILLASVALVVLAPVFVGVALAVWRRLGRPVLFRQVRPGRDGVPFVLWKFRTMRQTADGSSEPDANRLTAFGELLRSTSLDELPELVNVLRGEMSLVGPRPLLPEYLPLYNCEQARRHSVRPGITGWAQVNGRNALTWEERFNLDVWYVDHRCFSLDIKILLRTLVKLLTREGISHPGHATMAPFDGGRS